MALNSPLAMGISLRSNEADQIEVNELIVVWCANLFLEVSRGSSARGLSVFTSNLQAPKYLFSYMVQPFVRPAFHVSINRYRTLKFTPVEYLTDVEIRPHSE